MIYSRTVTLKNGSPCLIRSCTREDAQAVFDDFNTVHSETDFLLSYTDENSFDVAQEADFLAEKERSEREAELCAVVDGRIAGTAGIEAVGTKFKTSRRAELGIGIERAYWGLGIGDALVSACVECARLAGYAQLELTAVADNRSALALYAKHGFTEYGRNPRGFFSRLTGWQELVLMRLELE